MKGLEDLKQMLKDDRLWIAVGIIKKLHLAEDRSYLKVTVSVMPEDRQIVATMTWDAVGPDSGDFTFPVVDDVVLLAMSEGSDDEAYVIKRLTSRADKIPAIATDGSKVHKAIDGKKFWNISNTRINISRTEVEPTENLVLGQVFKQLMIDILTELKEHATIDSQHVHMGNLGYFTSVPREQSDYVERGERYDTIKESPVSDEAVLSDLSFTEK